MFRLPLRWLFYIYSCPSFNVNLPLPKLLPSSHGKNLPNVGQDYQCAKQGGGGEIHNEDIKNGVGVI